MDWDLCERNPAARVKLHREQNAKTRFLSSEEERKLLAACDDQLAAVVRFAICTGLRRGELTNLRWQDVNLGRQQIHIPARNAKSKRSRTIPLNDSAMEIVIAQSDTHHPNAFVFPNSRGGRMGNLHHFFRKAVLAAGLEDVSLHTLRHTFASRIVMANGSLVEARELLGHRDLTTTLIYAHLTDEHLRAAVKKIG
jgi:integrase